MKGEREERVSATEHMRVFKWPTHLFWNQT